MGGIDHKIEALLAENARETLSAAEPAREQPARKGHGFSGPAGERQGDVVARVAGERAGEVGSLAAAAKNEKLQRFHAADEVAL